jgi:hypothetical protein
MHLSGILVSPAHVWCVSENVILARKCHESTRKAVCVTRHVQTSSYLMEMEPNVCTTVCPRAPNSLTQFYTYNGPRHGTPSWCDHFKSSFKYLGGFHTYRISRPFHIVFVTRSAHVAICKTGLRKNVKRYVVLLTICTWKVVVIHVFSWTVNPYPANMENMVSS